MAQTQTREDGQSDEGPPEPEASEFAVGAGPGDYDGVATARGRRGGAGRDRRGAAPPRRSRRSWSRDGSSSSLLPLALLGLWALARAAGTVLLILLVASVVALILNPLVRMLEWIKVPRGLAIAAVYLSWVAVDRRHRRGAVRTGQHQVSHFQNDVPHLVRQANRDLANVQSCLNDHGIKVHIQQQGQTALQTLQKDVAQALGRHPLVLARPAASRSSRSGSTWS